MIKLMIIFQKPEPDQIRPFEEGYARLLRRIEKMPNIERRQVNSVVGSPQGPSRYYRVLELYFESRDKMEAALMSPEGQKAGEQLNAFSPDMYETLFAEVYEEAGGSTPFDMTSRRER